MSAKPGLVIFDCDGVLVDTERQVAVVTSDYLEDLGLSLSAEEAAVLFKGLANAEIKGLAEAMLGAPLAGNFVAEIDQRLVDAMSLGITVVPGVGEAIRRSWRRGAQCAWGRMAHWKRPM